MNFQLLSIYDLTTQTHCRHTCVGDRLWEGLSTLNFVLFEALISLPNGE